MFALQVAEAVIRNFRTCQGSPYFNCWPSPFNLLMVLTAPPKGENCRLFQVRPSSRYVISPVCLVIVVAVRLYALGQTAALELIVNGYGCF